MNENLDFILQIIRVDFFIAFGLYSILYVAISTLIKKPIIEIVDEISNKLINIIGIVFLIVWIILVIKTYFESSEYDRYGIMQRMFGKYWFGFWLQPLLWIITTQVLRLKKIRKSKPLRIIFSIIFIISLELYIILLSSFQSDYLPSSYHFPFTIIELISGIFTKLFFFLTYVGVYYFVERKLKLVIMKSK